jgi:hypothetical protein
MIRIAFSFSDRNSLTFARFVFLGKTIHSDRGKSNYTWDDLAAIQPGSANCIFISRR